MQAPNRSTAGGQGNKLRVPTWCIAIAGEPSVHPRDYSEMPRENPCASWRAWLPKPRALSGTSGSVSGLLSEMGIQNPGIVEGCERRQREGPRSAPRRLGGVR